MRSKSIGLLAAAVLAAAMAGGAAPAMAQPFGYGYDDGPPPFRRGPGWDRPPGWGPGWRHHRGWRDEGYGRRGGWRDGDRRGDRFGNDDGGGRGNRGGPRNEDARRGPGADEVPRRAQGQGRGGGGLSPFGGRESD